MMDESTKIQNSLINSCGSGGYNEVSIFFSILSIFGAIIICWIERIIIDKVIEKFGLKGFKYLIGLWFVLLGFFIGVGVYACSPEVALHEKIGNIIQILSIFTVIISIPVLSIVRYTIYKKSLKS